MTVTVLLFASYAEAIGAPEVSFDLPGGSTVNDVIGRVVALCATACGGLPPAPLVAVNQHYAAPDLVVKAGDEVAIIPPVAGG